MQITRETDYAIRCVYYLAKRAGEVIMIDEIAGEMEIPKSFLAKILQKLARAKLVASYRGVKGGFRLARKPAEISLYDVVTVIGGPVAMNICTLDEQQCGRSGQCQVHPVWLALRHDVEEALMSRKFSEFL